MKTLLALLLLASPLVAADAQAQDYEDLDSPGDSSDKKKKKRKKKAKKSRAAALESEIVREVERGIYCKSMVGATAYLAQLSQVMRAGTALSIAVGNDFVDTETSSMAYEVALYQGVHNGMHWEQQSSYLSTGELSRSQLTQGDTRTFGLLANYEYSIYPTRRLGIGFRAGAGLMLTPLLMERAAYERDVIGAWQTDAPIHKSPHPHGIAGPTLEYYTKLSHFSVGIDADVFYALGMDLGLSAQGFFKYSF